MEYSDSAMVTIGKFTGECDIVFEEAEGRFHIIRKPSSSGAGVAVRVMFGALGQAVMNSVANGEELASFTAADILEVNAEEKRRKTIFTIFPRSGDGPYIVTMLHKKELHNILRRELTERKSAPMPVTRMQPSPAPVPETPPAPQIIAPPAPPAAPVQPAAPAQPIPVQPMQPVPPAPQPVQQPQYNPYAQPQGYVPQQPPVYHQPPVQQPPVYRQPQPAQTGSIKFHVSSLNTEVTITLPAFTVGRDATSDLNLSRLPNAKYIARRQASFFRSGGKWYIRDENSTNGTLLNNRQIPGGQPQVLNAGDFISFAGKETLIVQELK